MANQELERCYIPFQCMIIHHVNRLRVEGVPAAQYHILDALAQRDGVTAKELTKLRGISQSGISKLVKGLLEKGYIVQERSQQDRRYYRIQITAEGRAFLDRSALLRNEILAKIESALTEEEVAEFARLCEKIVLREPVSFLMPTTSDIIV